MSPFKPLSSNTAKEIEATLIIRSKNPETVVKEIVSLTSIANYRLLPQDTQKIYDVYFDTQKEELQTKKFSLRIREIGITRWITLKGPTQPTKESVVVRLEIEEPWSKVALNDVFGKLRDENIEILLHLPDFDSTQPLDVMDSLGLKIIQHRETERRVRNIVPNRKESDPALAELAIDSVVYQIHDAKIRHHEVEIEAKEWQESSEVVEVVAESLAKKYGSELRRWDHSKLATGKAIKKLFDEGALEGLLDYEKVCSCYDLKPAAYDKIIDYLNHDNT